MFVVLLSALFVGQIATLSNEKFLQTLHGKCFSENLLLWDPKSAVSIENFIYMVEKLERNHDISTTDLVRTLLQKFSCNRLKPDVDKEWHRDDTGVWFENIVDQFLNDDKDKIFELSLTDKEECQLFFMLSPAKQEIVNSDSRETEEPKFYEHGVVSLNTDKQRAIDLSKVLYGILAGFKNSNPKRVEDFLNGKTGDKYADEQLDMLYSFTISEVINTEAENSKDFDVDSWHLGRWNSTSCTREYVNDNEPIFPTTAEITGAVDGFILGSKIKSMTDKDGIKLSQVLRMYYSKEGFKGNTADQSGVSYCNRLDGLRFDPQELLKQTINYMAVYRKLSSKPILAKREEIVTNAVNKFRPREILQTEAEREDCLTIQNKDTCVTQSNVFAFLDKREKNMTIQKLAVGELINALNIGLDEDAITIYLNADVENLQLIVNASDSKAQASCTLEDYKLYDMPNDAADAKVLADIKTILSIYEENQKSLLAVPAKVVVLFNFGELKQEEKGDLDKAVRELSYRHPYLTMIPIGTDIKYLKSYFTNKQPSRAFQWNGLNFIPDLKKRICEVPAVLQYRNCRTKSSFQDTEYKGYVSDLHVQHWTMYPRDFLKTFGYKFQFKAENGKIRVCFSRKEPVTDSGNSSNCIETKTEGDFVEFEYSDPCKDKTVHSCNPFYFSVFGRDTGDAGSACSREIDNKEVGCKRLDQIAYTIRHEGISCNSAMQVIGMPLFQTLLAFLITFYVLAWQK